MTTRQRSFFTWISLVALACAAYCTVLFTGFVSDDFTLVRAVRDSGPFGTWSGPHSMGSWFLRPVCSASYFLDYRIWHLHAAGYHFANLLLHGTNAYLLYLISSRMMGDRITSITAALVFVVMPIHAESVTWISGRTDVLATTFELTAFLGYLAFRDSGCIRDMSIVLGMFILGLFTKESVLTFPMILLCYEMVAKPPSRRGLRLGLITLALVVPYFVIRRFAVGGWIGGYGAGTHLNIAPRYIADNIGRFAAHALGLLPLQTDARRMTIGLIAAVGAMALMAVIGIIFVFNYLSRRRQSLSELGFFLVAFFVSLLPSVNLSISSVGAEGERFLYLPSVWLSVFICATLQPSAASTRLAACGALVVLYACGLIMRNESWRQASVLCRRVIDRLKSVPTDATVFVVNMPDSIHGAYVFRNSIWDALPLERTDPAPVYIIAYHHLSSTSDNVDVSGRPERLSLRVREGFLEYRSVPNGTALSRYNLIDREATRLSVDFDSRSAYQVLAFGGGDLRRVNCSAARSLCELE